MCREMEQIYSEGMKAETMQQQRDNDCPCRDGFTAAKIAKGR